ncbi:MAG TPA: hypothetical protein DDY21_00065 [Candidatus Moranbacteria bacterium]|nr:hypothetical protein [Candidatus Moranbacteria bacterium]
MFGFIDLLCIRDKEILGVQTTTGANSASRVEKIKNHANYHIVKQAGIKISVHGWRKLQKKCKNGNVKMVWECKEIIIN